jgi:hypothetical protein
MTTLLLLAVVAVAGLLLNALLLWGIAKLFRAEGATFLSAMLGVVLLTVAGVGILVVQAKVGTPAALAAALGLLVGQVGLQFLLHWAMARWILRASDGKAALIAVCDLVGAGLLGTGIYLGLIQLVATYVIPTNSMSPSLLGYHFQVACPHCKGVAIVSAPQPGIELFPIDFEQPRNGMCLNCWKVSEFQNYKGEIHSGDRIMCNRLLTPARWDVIVSRRVATMSLLFARCQTGQSSSMFVPG